MSNKQGRIISIILLSIAVSIMFVRKARADEKENWCLEHPNSDICDTMYLKEVKISQELQVKHLRDISINLKEIVEQLVMIRKQLEGALR